MTVINFKNIDQLKTHLKSLQPTLYVGSQTSTVIPYDKLDNAESKMIIGNLSNLPKILEMGQFGVLKISGPVTWQEAKEFCLSKGKKIMTSPTEELALCLSGIATSATGERCFKFGTLRDQIIEIVYIDQNGKENTLNSNKLINENSFFKSEENQNILKEYQSTYEKYKKFKNAPFPRMEKEIDLMVGTEGQLGIITEAKFKTTELNDEMYIFLKLPRWENDCITHINIFNKIQEFRNVIESCEFIDENSLSYLPAEERPTDSGDLLFLEVPESEVENLYESLLCKLEGVDADDIFEMNPAKCRQLRMNIPRNIFEENQRMNVLKMGTDVQVHPDQFSNLMKLYQSWKKEGISYNLFGHFGDAHLHFNFMPTQEQVPRCKELLLQFYKDVAVLGGSPFAEHGIGTLKQNYIRNFYEPIHQKMFLLLKKQFDPENVLFPAGFMSMVTK